MISSRELAEALRSALTDEHVAVPVRAFIASVVMTARGRAPSRLGMAKVGGYSYGSSQTHYGTLLNALCERVPHLVAEMVSDITDPAFTARLQDELHQRDARLAALRAEHAALTERHEHLRRYALAIHQRLAAIDGGERLEDAKIYPFRPLD